LAFVVIVITLLIVPLYLHAEGDVAEESSKTSLEDVNKGIISERSPIIGYQPLTVAGQKIDATYLEEVLGKRYGAIILLHDMSDSIEDQGVVTPLRHALPQYGWSTLTVALDYPFEPVVLLSPTLEDVSEAKASNTEEKPSETTDTQLMDKKEASPTLPPISNLQRIEAAIAFLKAKNIDRIIVLGHGNGGNIAVGLFDKITATIAGLILIGAPELADEDKKIFSGMQKPILDLYGERDLAGVEQAVLQRKVIMKRGINNRYVMRKVTGADHFFTGLTSTLVITIRGWLNVTFIEPKKQN